MKDEGAALGGPVPAEPGDCESERCPGKGHRSWPVLPGEMRTRSFTGWGTRRNRSRQRTRTCPAAGPRSPEWPAGGATRPLGPRAPRPAGGASARASLQVVASDFGPRRGPQRGGPSPFRRRGHVCEPLSSEQKYCPKGGGPGPSLPDSKRLGRASGWATGDRGSGSQDT